MKQLYMLFFGLLLTFAANAQAIVTVSPNTLEYTITETETHDFHLAVTNTSANTINVFWKLIKVNYPQGWTTIVCDDTLCYGPNTDKNSASKPNIIAAGETVEFKITVNPNSIKGASIMYLQLFSDSGFSNLIFETVNTAVFTATSSTGTKGVIASELSIYPNPSTDYFGVRNDANIERIGIYNIVGKEIKTFRHSDNETHDINDLSKGMYIVRLMDARNKVIKTLRMSVR